MPLRTLKEADVRGKRVLLREDLNVPQRDGRILDYKRIDAALPTIRTLMEHGARVIIVSHLGRPEGKRNAKYSLQPIADAIAQRLGAQVAFAADCIGPAAHDVCETLRDGQVAMLENVRFEPGEERNDAHLAKQLASLADVYVDDAFGTAHRAHASTEGVAHCLPSFAGLLMESEIAALSKLLDDPEHPFVCVIGGAKIKDKVGVFQNLMNRVNTFCIGGGMANTFLAAEGIDVGTSLRDDDLQPAGSMLELARKRNVLMLLPEDAVVSDSYDDDAGARTVDLPDVGNAMILDVGPKTAARYAEAIERARTIVFNGPMGVYEKAPYRQGTRVVLDAMARATERGACTVVGGGDAAAAADELGFADKVSHVSTGGGATLEFLEGKELPGIKVLQR